MTSDLMTPPSRRVRQKMLSIALLLMLGVSRGLMEVWLRVGDSLKEEKKLAREVLSQHIKEVKENEKRMSNGINVSPVTTRGEVTTTISTTKSSSSPNKRSSSNSPLLHKKLLPDHMTQFSKAGSAPPSIPPEEGGGNGLIASPISKAKGVKELNTIGKQNTPPTLMGVVYRKDRPQSDSSNTSNEQVSSIKDESTESSTDLYSPTEDFTFVASEGGHTSHGKLNKTTSGTNSLNQSDTCSNQPYNQLNELSSLNKHNSWGHNSNVSSQDTLGLPVSSAASQQPNTSDSIFYLRSECSSRMSNSSTESGIYDHLPTLSSPLQEEEFSLDMTITPPTVAPPHGELSIRKYTSQPALSTPSSARESPCDRLGQFGSINEESSDDEETRATPTNTDDEIEPEKDKKKYDGVTLRQKKRIVEEDPFADLLSPKACSRLRWSQELNPLYDYIKGFKADGVKLYDSSPVSKLLLSTNASNIEGGLGGGASGKPPSVIIEDEGEGFEEPADDDSLSMLSMTSQDTVNSPTFTYPSFEEESERKRCYGVSSRVSSDTRVNCGICMYYGGVRVNCCCVYVLWYLYALC